MKNLNTSDRLPLTVSLSYSAWSDSIVDNTTAKLKKIVWVGAEKNGDLGAEMNGDSVAEKNGDLVSF